MRSKYTIILVLRSGGDFSFRDVDLLSYHLHRSWKGDGVLQILCITDMMKREVKLPNLTLLPMDCGDWPGWWSKLNLFSPELEKYRPFLYMDLDTAVVGDISLIFPEDASKFMSLEDFYRPGRLASGLLHIPAEDDRILFIWKAWKEQPKQWMSKFAGDQQLLYHITKVDGYWSSKDGIFSFKPKKQWLKVLPENARVICFHGKPRIPEAAKEVAWVSNYEKRLLFISKPKVTVIIPYKEDRGWLKEAINSIKGEAVQVILSKGDGNWASNFNKALPEVKGEYVRFLHEDDMLTTHSIDLALQTFEEQGVDFIHSPALILQDGELHTWIPKKIKISFDDLMEKNYIHGATTMYKTKIFEEIGGFDETLPDSEEYEFHLRCLKAGYKLGYCKESLGIYRRHAKQKSRIIRGSQMNKTSQQIKATYL